MRRIVAVNDSGHVIGGSHHLAKFTDREIDLMHELHEGGMSLKLIAEKFDTSKGTAHDIVNGRRRGHTVFGHKTLGPPRLRYRFSAAHPDEFEVVPC